MLCYFMLYEKEWGTRVYCLKTEIKIKKKKKNIEKEEKK